MLRSRRLRLAVTLFLLIQFTLQTFLPAVSYALTSGPSQPEFSSFESVSTNNMVDDFTGDFTYTLPIVEVPGPSGGSYPLTLSYHSGTTPEEEASWVGYGWTLSPGAINRGVRGIPDDFKSDNIVFHNKSKRNYTITAGWGLSVTPEIFSFDKQFFSAGINATYRYNNFRGFSKLAGVGISLGRGVFNLGYTVSEGESSYSLNINPAALLNYVNTKGKDESSAKTTKEKQSSAVKKSFVGAAKKSLSFLNYGTGSTYGIFTYNQAVLPTQVNEYSGNSFNVSGAINLDPSGIPIGVGGNVIGSYTYQDNTAQTQAPGYGYMYSANAPTYGIMDYHIDRENPYDKQDLFLGTPFNDADNFSITGEGIGGSFRLYNTNLGHFAQRQVSSNMTFYNTSVEFEVGQNFGAGGDIGIGFYKMDANDWDRNLSTFNDPNSTSIDEPVLFRFGNDPGGSWGDNVSDRPERFGMQKSGGNATLQAPASFPFNQAANGRSKRSSYIGYHTNAEMLAAPFRSYSKRSDIDIMARRSSNPDRIGEISVTNEDGLRYTYALPVYSKKESNLSFGLKGTTASQIEKNSIAYNWNEGDTKVGQVRDAEYAHSYLLTDIQTTDYLDASPTTDGSTQDDFGGYVRFGYDKVYGDNADNNAWYKWRMPYNGAGYQRNQLSDPGDDIATLSSGQKEIYYVKSIETKTHLAVFSTSNRTDGYGALDDNAAKTKGAKSTDALKRLDRIDLYSLQDLQAISALTRVEGNIVIPNGAKPIKTVYFKYYETDELSKQLMSGAPNATNGRLTLKRVYFEYNGVSQARINPYTFKYNYPSSTDPVEPIVYPTKYNNIKDFGAAVDSKPYWNNAAKYCTVITDPENPPYGEFNVDAWGNYQPFGCNQSDSMRTWINQRWKPNVDYDPAAWQLKRIGLPSGGEIHIQYEQDDYQYVQDQAAHAMVRLKADAGATTSRFFIDIRDLGLSWSDADISTKVNTLKDQITDRYIGTGKSKMYFKFLYQLFTDPSMPNQQTCNAENIAGYAKVSGVTADVANKKFYIDFEPNNLPKKKCYEYVFANAVGRVNTTTICDRSVETIPDRGSAGQMVMAFLAAGEAIKGKAVEANYCGKINESFSYLRLPVVNPKLGGGLRVKRLLMYDNGIDGVILYGSEFDYSTTENGRKISSGVATNEPASIREENILIDYIPKRDQSWENKLIVGKDKEQYEGPPGESIYPGPSVGYAKVTVTNIHSGKTNPGFQVKEFFTAKDYPIKWDKTDINHRSDPKIRFALIANQFINRHWATQGYSFVMNNMHGQFKRTASYAYGGDYAGGVDITKASLVSEKVFEFYQPGELVPVMSALYGTVTNKPIGREADVTLSQKSVSEASYDGNLEMDFTVGVFGILPIPFLGAMPSFTQNEAVMKTHVTAKVIRYPAIIKKVTTVQDGIYHIDENVAFDEFTGKPVAIKSHDEFVGAYIAQQIPASWQYNNFTQQAATEDKLFISDATSTFNVQLVDPSAVRAKLVFGGTNGCERLSELVTGDLLELNSGNLYNVESINYASDYAVLVKAKVTSSAVTALITGITPQFRILKSGRNNQLNQKAGNIVFHNVDKNALTASSNSVSAATRYDATSSFVVDLNAKMAITPRPSEFILTGPYTGMNMSAYQSMSPCCAADWANATVSNIKFKVMDDGTQVSLYMMEFDIDCGTTACGTQIVKIKN
jgi:hypothetical protein